jgi:hypothetical protein
MQKKVSRAKSEPKASGWLSKKLPLDYTYINKTAYKVNLILNIELSIVLSGIFSNR